MKITYRDLSFQTTITVRAALRDRHCMLLDNWIAAASLKTPELMTFWANELTQLNNARAEMEASMSNIEDGDA